MAEPDSSDLGFGWVLRKSGDVEITHHGRLAATLRGKRALRFADDRTRLAPAELQQLMARLTGNYRRGNERQAGGHPRNRR